MLYKFPSSESQSFKFPFLYIQTGWRAVHSQASPESLNTRSGVTIAPMKGNSADLPGGQCQGCSWTWDYGVPSLPFVYEYLFCASCNLIIL